MLFVVCNLAYLTCCIRDSWQHRSPPYMAKILSPAGSGLWCSQHTAMTAKREQKGTKMKSSGEKKHRQYPLSRIHSLTKVSLRKASTASVNSSFPSDVTLGLASESFPALEDVPLLFHMSFYLPQRCFPLSLKRVDLARRPFPDQPEDWSSQSVGAGGGCLKRARLTKSGSTSTSLCDFPSPADGRTPWLARRPYLRWSLLLLLRHWLSSGRSVFRLGLGYLMSIHRSCL